MSFDPYSVRDQFPALNQTIDGQAPIFLDGPGGTQVPQCVLDAMSEYLGLSNSNLLPSPFFAVQNTIDVVAQARSNAAAFLNAESPNQIVFGANMSSITAHMSRSVSQEWEEGDEIILTSLDHFGNVSFWRQAAEDKGVKVHVVQMHPEDCTLDYEHLESVLSEKTKLIAFTLASNVCGSRTDAHKIIDLAKSVGALAYVDSVHYAPHFLPDVQALDCDFLACSAYKFFGPHLGILYGKKQHLERLKPYKVEVALDTIPDRWETGTKSFEALSGFNAMIGYLSNNQKNIRENLKVFYEDVSVYEQAWSAAFLEKAQTIKGMNIHGITNPDQLDLRTSTFAVTIDGHHVQDISDHLAKNQIATGASTFYGNGVTDALNLTDTGGVVRIGAVHYNTMEELDRTFEVLDQL